MNRRLLGVTLTLVLSCLSMAGCQWLNHGLRSQDRDPDVTQATAEAVGSDGDKVLDVQDNGKQAKPFFRPSRLSGGLSSEAREIENNLGIR
jgi:hypothetical protein